MASCHGEELVEKALGTALVHGKGGSRYEQPWSTVRARPRNPTLESYHGLVTNKVDVGLASLSTS